MKEETRAELRLLEKLGFYPQGNGESWNDST